jgi:hypothetical protein
MRGGRPKARLTLRDLRFKYTCIKQSSQINVVFCLGLVHLVHVQVPAKPGPGMKVHVKST